MKNFFRSALLVVASALLLTSCNCFSKIAKKVDTLTVECSPSVLSLKGDAVDANFTVSVPAKFFVKTAVVKITPVLKYEGGEIVGTPKFYQGEKVRDNYKVIPYSTASTITESVSFPYKPEAKSSELVLRVEAKCCKDCKDSSKQFVALDEELVVAQGVGTVQLLAYNFAEVAFAKDNFKRVTTETDEANIMFLINRSNVRNDQLTSADVAELQKFIVENSNQPKRTVSDLYAKAYASPDGPLNFNDKLSVDRGTQTGKALEKKFKKDEMPVDVKLDIDALGEDWDGFKELVEKSDIPEKDLIIQILGMYSDPQKRDAEIKNMTSVFNILKEKILPELRRSKLIVNVDVEGLSDAELKSAVAGNINSLKLEELLFAATLYSDNATKEKIYKTVTKNFASEWRGWNNLGCVYAQEGDIAGAKSAFMKAAQINSSSNEVVTNLGIIALSEGQKAEAKRFFSSINTPEAKYNLGLAELAMGNYSAATKSLSGYNQAVAEVCNGNLSRAKSILAGESCAASSYLKAIIAAMESDEASVLSNLSTAVSKDKSFADMAEEEVYFLPFQEGDKFKAIVK